jgi:hypothetical protein
VCDCVLVSRAQVGYCAAIFSTRGASRRATSYCLWILGRAFGTGKKRTKAGGSSLTKARRLRNFALSIPPRPPFWAIYRQLFPQDAVGFCPSAKKEPEHGHNSRT